MTPIRAEIIELESSRRFSVHFQPAGFSICSRAQSSEPARLEVELSCEDRANEASLAREIVELASSGNKAGRGRPCLFLWGDSQSFYGSLESVTQRLIPAPDSAIRISLSCTFLALEEERASRPLGGCRVRVRWRDSLSCIASRVYGDPRRWRVIAEANGIENPLELEQGRELWCP